MAKKVKARTQAAARARARQAQHQPHPHEAASTGAAAALAPAPATVEKTGLPAWLNARNISIFFAVIALAVSGYLAYNEAFGGEVACIQAAGFDCDLVQSSAYSEIFGIKVAYTGLAANIVVLLMLIFEDRIELLRDNGPVLIFGILLFGMIFSIWLVYVQAVLLRSFCQWCLLHELAYLGLFIAGIFRLRKALT